MILRILGEGQYNLPDSAMTTLQELDLALEQALDAEDDQRFRPALIALLDYVRQYGTKLADDSLESSEAILPADDSHVDEVRALLTAEGEGIVPGV